MNANTNNEIDFLANNYKIKVKFSKTNIYKIIKSGEFLGKPLGPLLKITLLLAKNIFTALAKSVPILLELTKSSAAADAGIQKKFFGD